MRNDKDAFFVGPAPLGQLNQLIEAMRPAVVAAAELTGNGRTFTMKAVKLLEGPDSIAHISIRYDDDPVTAPELTKTRTQVIETFTMGTYSSPVLDP